MVRGRGFEPRNPYGTAPSTLRRWPDLATPANAVEYFLQERSLEFSSTPNCSSMISALDCTKADESSIQPNKMDNPPGTECGE